MMNQDTVMSTKFVVLLDSMSTLHHWIEEYMEYCRVEKGLSENSLQSYSRDLTRLLEFSDKKNGNQDLILTYNSWNSFIFYTPTNFHPHQ